MATKSPILYILSSLLLSHLLFVAPVSTEGNLCEVIKSEKKNDTCPDPDTLDIDELNKNNNNSIPESEWKLNPAVCYTILY